MKRLRERHIVLGITVLSLLAVYPSAFRFSSLLDEGIVLNQAARMVRGEQIYKDFFAIEGPFAPWVIMNTFKVVGVDALAQHLWLWILRGALAPLVYLAARPICSRTTATLSALAVTCVLGLEPWNSPHHWFSTGLALLSLVCWQYAWRGKFRALASTAGVLTVALVFTIPTKVLCPVMAVLATFPGLSERTRLRLYRDYALWYGLGILAGMAPLAWWLITNSVGTELYRHLISYNASRAVDQLVPWGFALQQYDVLEIVCLLLPPGIAVVGLMVPGDRNPLKDPSGRALAAGALILLAAGLYRPLPSGLQTYGFLCLPLAFQALARVRREIVWVLLIPILVMGWLQGTRASQADYPLEFPNGTIWMRSSESVRSHQELITFLQRKIPGEKRVLVLPYQPYLTFLMGYENPTRQDILLNSWRIPKEMEELSSDIEAKRVPVILYFPVYDSPGFLRQVTPLLDIEAYLEVVSKLLNDLENSYERKDYGPVVIYQRK